MEQLKQLTNINDVKNNINDNIDTEIKFIESIQVAFKAAFFDISDSELTVNKITSDYFNRDFYLQCKGVFSGLQNWMNVLIETGFVANDILIPPDYTSLSEIKLWRPSNLVLNSTFIKNVNSNWKLIDEINNQFELGLKDFGIAIK